MRSRTEFPPILFLDEPTSGVDPLSRRMFWDLIAEFVAGGTTVFVSTHYMDEAEYCEEQALLMQSIGISMVLGPFLAGVLVADSEYRYQLESDIEHFKGLLLGLFFMAVGMTANLGLLIMAITLSMMMTPVLLYLVERLMKKSTAIEQLPGYDVIDAQEPKVIIACFALSP